MRRVSSCHNTSPTCVGLLYPVDYQEAALLRISTTLVSVLGNTDRMPQFTPEQLEQRRQRMAEAEGLGGWYMNSLCDGRDVTTGEPLSWYEYRHLDGRRATVSESGSSTDPELQNLLAEKRRAEPLPSPEPPWWLSPTGVLRALSSWLAVSRAKSR